MVRVLTNHLLPLRLAVTYYILVYLIALILIGVCINAGAVIDNNFCYFSIGIEFITYIFEVATSADKLFYQVFAWVYTYAIVNPCGKFQVITRLNAFIGIIFQRSTIPGVAEMHHVSINRINSIAGRKCVTLISLGKFCHNITAVFIDSVVP